MSCHFHLVSLFLFMELLRVVDNYTFMLFGKLFYVYLTKNNLQNSLIYLGN